MLAPQNTFVMYEEELQRITALIEKLLRESNSKNATPRDSLPPRSRAKVQLVT